MSMIKIFDVIRLVLLVVCVALIAIASNKTAGKKELVNKLCSKKQYDFCVQESGNYVLKEEYGK